MPTLAPRSALNPASPDAAAFTRDRTAMVLLVSGVLGFLLGSRTFPDLQRAVESAQVLSGVVQYVPGTSAFTPHASAWSLVHQALAGLLALGVSELRLSVLLGSVLGMVSLQALAVIVYALSRHGAYAVLAGLVVLVSRTAEFGTAYPIALLGGPEAVPGIALSLVVLAAALLGNGWRQSGAFLFGVLPAIDPATGIWSLPVSLCLLAVWGRDVRAETRSLVRGFAAGAALMVLSLLLHIALGLSLPFASLWSADPHLTQYVRTWDMYRQPVSVLTDAVYLNVTALVLAAAWLIAFTTDLPRPATVVLKFVVIAALLALGLALLTWLPVDVVPAIVTALMPGRLLNVNAMLCVALLLGLIGTHLHKRPGTALGLLTLLGLLVVNRSLVWSWMPEARQPAWVNSLDPWFVFQAAALLLVLLALRTWNAREGGLATPAMWHGARVTRPTMAAVIGLLVIVFIGAWQLGPRQAIADWRNDPLYRVAASGQGLLLPSASLRFIQLRTRRPLLVDGDLRALPSALDGASNLVQILRDIYGVDFFAPPDEALHTAAIPNGRNKAVWEAFSAEDWQRIGRNYQVADVVTNADWTLSLPVAAQSRGLRLYHIPK